ncbi:MAG: sulfur oxidation c-type cytochrome SoxA [Gammaproteobacteria bacterium]
MSPKAVLYLLIVLAFPSSLPAEPEDDRNRLRQHYQKLFPGLGFADYADGVYAIDSDARDSWEQLEEFPPYEPFVELGEIAFAKPFKDGNVYGDCFPNGGIGIAQTYPRWDPLKAEVVTLEKALNDCRQAHRETPLPYSRGEITQLLAFMAYTSRGKPIAIKIPDDPKALKAYEQGKSYYYTRRGQLNFACATCHVQNAGRRIRSETLSPMLGQTSGWPTYRLEWGEMGTLHRRFIGCNEQIRAEPSPPQSVEYRNLEYFMTYLSNGIPFNGPSLRK